MSETDQNTPCPFVAQLVGMLLEDRPSALGRQRSRLFCRLIDLEAEARRRGAPEANRQLIARVRRIAGTATVIPFRPVSREP